MLLTQLSKYFSPDPEKLDTKQKVYASKQTNIKTNLPIQRQLIRSHCGGKTFITCKDLRLSREDKNKRTHNQEQKLKDEILNNLLKEQQKLSVIACLDGHEITPEQRTQMIDWMVEVTDAFSCDHQTFFYSVSIMDRYFKACDYELKSDDLHLIGATSMYIASKFEDRKPIKMTEMVQKICHNEFRLDQIKEKEREMLTVLDYQLMTPTVLDFLKFYLESVLDIQVLRKTDTKDKEKEAIACHNSLLKLGEDSSQDDQATDTTSEEATLELSQEEKEMKVQQYLIEKLAIYYAKMCMYDLKFATKLPSILAGGVIQVTLMIYEKLKNNNLMNQQRQKKLIKIGQMNEDQLVGISRLVLLMAQDFDQNYPDLCNLRNTHFGIIMKLMDVYPHQIQQQKGQNKNKKLPRMKLESFINEYQSNLKI